ncbi:MAG: ATP-binding cassette domain-containing protein [Candidatus Anammoxibacter sp.]
MIELNKISKSYGDLEVLNCVSIQFCSGMTHILLGPSGCGKSTILRLIIGLERPDSGEIHIDGKNLFDLENSEIAKYFGYVIQDKTLMPHLNVTENILLPVKARKASIDSIKDHLEFLKELVEVDQDLMEKYPSQLSGGQKQKVCLIRALILDPPYLLMDEPFSALDPMIRSTLQMELKKIFSKLKKTVIFVTHDLNEASLLGENIIIINKGDVVQEGQMQDLKTNPASEFVKSFFKAQVQHF